MNKTERFKYKYIHKNNQNGNQNLSPTFIFLGFPFWELGRGEILYPLYSPLSNKGFKGSKFSAFKVLVGFL